MSKFDEFFQAVKDGVVPLAKDFAVGLRDTAIDDMKDFLDKKKDDLGRWTELLARGDITPREFRMMVNGSRSLLKLKALRIAGVQTARLQRLRDAVIDLVTEKALAVFLP